MDEALSPAASAVVLEALPTSAEAASVAAEVTPQRRRPKQATSAEDTIRSHLRQYFGRLDRRFTSVIEGVWRIGGADGVVHWTLARLDKNIGSPAETAQLRKLLKSIVYAERRGHRLLIAQWEEERALEEVAYQKRQARNEERLRQRAMERLMADPRAEVRERLERNLRLQPAAPTPEVKETSSNPQVLGVKPAVPVPLRTTELMACIEYELWVVREVLQDPIDWDAEEPAELAELLLDVQTMPAGEFEELVAAAKVREAERFPKSLGSGLQPEAKVRASTHLSKDLDNSPQPAPVEPEPEPAAAEIEQEPPQHSSEDPPVPAFGGMAERAPDDSAAGGCGFTHELSGNAWQLVAGVDVDERGEVESLEHLDHLLRESPEVAGPMLMGALVRLRAALQGIPRDADALQPVCIPATDAVLLSRSVLRGLR